MIKKCLFFILIVLTCSACSIYQIGSEDVSDSFHASKQSAADVEYVEKVTRPHEVIGFVTVNTERRQRLPEIIESMKKEAATLGGDAITNITSNSTGIWKKIPAQKLLSNAYIRANFTATVIVYQ